MLKLKKLTAILSAALLAFSSAAPALADDSEAQQPQTALWLDFTNEETCRTYIDNAVFSNGASLSVRSKALGGFGVFAVFDASAQGADKPYVTFNVDGGLSGYSYAKIAYSYSTCRNSGSAEMKSFIRLADGAENTVATIASNGASLTDASGSEYKSSSYTTNARGTKVISTVLPLESATDGASSITFCPAQTADGTAVNCGVLLKYIALFQNKEDADRFDLSVSGAEFKKEGSEDVFTATVAPVANTAHIVLPKLYVSADEFSDANIELKLADKLSSATVASVDGFNVIYTVSAFDGTEHIWTVSVDCRQIDSENTEKMLADLNGATADNISEVADSWNWIWENKCTKYALLDDGAKDAFLNAAVSNAGGYTADNWADMIDREAVFASLVSKDGFEQIKQTADAAGLQDSAAYKIFFENFTDDERNTVAEAAKTSVNYKEFKEKLYLAIYSSSVSYGNIKQLIEGDLEYFGFSETSYNDLISQTDDLQSAYMAIVSLDVADTAQIAAELEKAVKQIGKIKDDDDEVSNVSTKKTGGGGGGGGKISVSVPGTSSEDGTILPPQPEKEPEKAEGFNDLNLAPWAQDSINSLAEKGIVNGKTPTGFAPLDNVKREEFVKMIVSALAIDGSADITFDDVKSTEWYADFIKKAVGANIINGIDQKTFGIGSDITREDMAVIAKRALLAKLGSLDGDGRSDFADIADIADYAKDAVDTLCSLGILNGDNGRFMPKNIATRAETAVVIDRLMSFVERIAQAGGNQ